MPLNFKHIVLGLCRVLTNTQIIYYIAYAIVTTKLSLELCLRYIMRLK